MTNLKDFDMAELEMKVTVEMSTVRKLTKLGAQVVGGKEGGEITPALDFFDHKFRGPGELPFYVNSEMELASFNRKSVDSVVFLNNTHYTK